MSTKHLRCKLKILRDRTCLLKEIPKSDRERKKGIVREREYIEKISDCDNNLAMNQSKKSIGARICAINV